MKKADTPEQARKIIEQYAPTLENDWENEKKAMMLRAAKKATKMQQDTFEQAEYHLPKVKQKLINKKKFLKLVKKISEDRGVLKVQVRQLLEECIKNL